MRVIKRTVQLDAHAANVLLPEGAFKIDRRERPGQSGWYDIEYDPFDQFISVIGPSPDLNRRKECQE